MSPQVHGQARSDSNRETTSGISIPLQSLSKADAVFDANTPICMLNLLRFHTTAMYPTDQAQPSTTSPISGREAYMTRYVPAFMAITSKISPSSAPITPIFIGAPTYSLVTKESTAVDLQNDSHIHDVDNNEDTVNSQWDMVGLISYPNLEAFRTLITCPEYLETALQHRLASLQDWRLIVTSAIEV